MPLATFRGEQTIDEIVDKLFVEPTDRQREIAAAAMLKANPQLAEINKMSKGTVLRVPNIPELRAQATRGLDNPDAQIAAEISKALSDYEERFSARAKQALSDNNAQTTLLKSAEFNSALSKTRQLRELATRVGNAVDARNKDLLGRNTDVAEAIQRLAKNMNEEFG